MGDIHHGVRHLHHIGKQMIARTFVTITVADEAGQIVQHEAVREGQVEEQAQFLSWLRDQGIALMTKLRTGKE